MKKSKWLNEALPHLVLILIISFVTFSEFRISIGISISFLLDLFYIPDNICGWIGFFGFPIMILLAASAVILGSIRSWLLSIPVQLLVYSICWYFAYESFDVMKCAKLIGVILVLQAAVIGIKALVRWLIGRKKQPAIIEQA